ncbi:helix-turn-helix transcriptional regulator [Alicyclobacillus sp. SO9]|uniref:helix-turn-helix transcriptional regulator n=1 Tax=Alicyclobacillus sp. SO9 TaxID=2665646 RepID=UPI0018E7D9B9|nr:ATP-binding protein [Alicyclobacillus sp. SO9]QQE79538.1 hypothetical protein GI364_03315 [Alicyclobacillus sp. SO9]
MSDKNSGQHSRLSNVYPIQLYKSHAFTARDPELRNIESWLNTDKPSTYLAWISGIGGIGKTTLMMEMRNLCRQASVRTLWLDGRTCLRMPSDFLLSIDMTLQYEYGLAHDTEVPLLEHIRQALSAHRTAIFLDNCEHIDVIESWFLSSFLFQLPPKDVLLVLGSRTELPIKWRSQPNFNIRIEQFILDVFTPQEIAAYLHQHQLPDEVVDTVAQKTQGHPLSLVLAVDALQRSSQGAVQAVQSIDGIISADILKEVTTSDLYDALQVLSVLPGAQLMHIEALTGKSMSIQSYQQLQELSFVGYDGQGLSLQHDIVTQVLRRTFYQRNAAAFRRYCKNAIMLLAEQYPSATKLKQMQIAVHVLELYLEFIPVHSDYANFPSSARPGPQKSFELADLPHLHRMLDSAIELGTWLCEFVEPDSYHELLDFMAFNYPQGIRIVRSESGVPLTLGISVWLHEGTLPLLERYAPRYLQDALAQELPDLQTRPEEFMDSLCLLISIVDVTNRHHLPEKLGVLSFMDWYTLVGAGARLIVASGDEIVNQLMRQFGYREKLTLPEERASDGISVFELDFRNENFLRWANTMALQLDNTQTPNILFAQPTKLAVSREEVGQMLKDLYRPNALGNTNLAQRLQLTGTELQQHLQSLLQSSPPTMPLTKLHQDILRESYGRKQVTKAALAGMFNMSRTTLHRHTRQAIEALAEALATAYSK